MPDGRPARESLPAGRVRSAGTGYITNMPGGINVHVQPEGDEWLVMREGETEAISRHATEDEAVQTGRAAAQSEQSVLFIHGHDGEVRERDSYDIGPQDLGA